MRNRIKIFYTAVAVLCCGVLFSGCDRDDDAFGTLHEATVQLSVGADVVNETDGAPSAAESKINTLRVYAFVGGRPAGYYYTDALTMTEGKHTFFMDLAFYSDGKQTVNFYAVANEKAMALKMASTSEDATFPLTETTSEAELNGVWFNNKPRAGLDVNGLPMFCKLPPVELDFQNVKAETPPAGSGHDGHMLLNYDPIKLELQRPVGKIGVFVAKAAGETSALRVTGLSSLANGVKVRNYLMPQSQETLQAVLSGGENISIAVIDGEVSAELSDTDDRNNPANYTPVMAEPFYPYENPWSNGGGWDKPVYDASGRILEHTLKIDYQFEGDEPRTGYVYMPAIERNHYYAVCCLIHDDGRIYIEYLVKDWNTPEGGDYNIDFDYPAYGNPIMPKDVSDRPDGQQLPQPTVYYNMDANDPAGSYTFRFNIRRPINQPWCPVMLNATTDDFEIEVYQKNLDGSKVVKYRYGGTVSTPQIYDCVADPEDDPFYITVKPLKPDNVGKTMGLGIAYRETWLPENEVNLAHSPLLLINGLTSDLAYEGSSYAEFVTILQVAAPDANDPAEPTPDVQ